jgi:hypothetical protein
MPIHLTTSCRPPTEIIEVVLNKASDNNDDHFEVCNRKIDSLLQKIDTA